MYKLIQRISTLTVLLLGSVSVVLVALIYLEVMQNRSLLVKIY